MTQTFIAGTAPRTVTFYGRQVGNCKVHGPTDHALDDAGVCDVCRTPRHRRLRRYEDDPIPLDTATTEFVLDRAGHPDHVVAGGRVHVRVEWTLCADGVRESGSTYELAPNEQRELFAWLGF